MKSVEYTHAHTHDYGCNQSRTELLRRHRNIHVLWTIFAIARFHYAASSSYLSAEAYPFACNACALEPVGAQWYRIVRFCSQSAQVSSIKRTRNAVNLRDALTETLAHRVTLNRDGKLRRALSSLSLRSHLHRHRTHYYVNMSPREMIPLHSGPPFELNLVRCCRQ